MSPVRMKKKNEKKNKKQEKTAGENKGMLSEFSFRGPLTLRRDTAKFLATTSSSRQ